MPVDMNSLSADIQVEPWLEEKQNPLGPAKIQRSQRIHSEKSNVGGEQRAVEELLAHIDEKIEYALQPIVNIHTGASFGYEALLRGQDRLGFATINDFFNGLYSIGALHKADMILRSKAIDAFSRIRRPEDSRLFFNVDRRILDCRDFVPKQTQRILKNFGFSPEILCLEISEKFEINAGTTASRFIDTYRQQNYKLAIDDFGAGFSGLKLLYDQQPDFVKIDRFFISGISRDPKKKLFVSTIVNLSHVLGVTVVAEGVENEEEYRWCKAMGCDLIQGYFVARPTTEISAVKPRYEKVEEINRRDRRSESSDHKIISEQIELLPTLNIDEPITNVFEAFAQNKNMSFFPVVTSQNEPVGLVHERDLKSYAYSPFGKELISNKAFGLNLRDFTEKIPTADIHTETETILELFSLGGEHEGIIITNDFSYVGFLSTPALLRVVNEKNIAQAKAQDPLTRLPGNASINDHIMIALETASSCWTLVYFDFDNFKPFNDTYGFRQGDRALLLFAELMRKKLGVDEVFLGHVGGDDFFAAFKNIPLECCLQRVTELMENFRLDVESFYNEDARKKGCITALDRDGNEKCYSLLTCSAAVLALRAIPHRSNIDDVISLFATLKKEAKASQDKISIFSLI